MARVLVIDDEPEIIRRTLTELGADLEVAHPEDLTLDQLSEAHVALVDHHLSSKNWPQRDELPFAAQPADGIALAGILLGHLRRREAGHFPPTAIALFSNQLSSVTPGLQDPPEHLAARASALHWAFSKSTLDGSLVRRVRSL